jgi:hypothetical protein
VPHTVSCGVGRAGVGTDDLMSIPHCPGDLGDSCGRGNRYPAG